ncbi:MULTISPECIES: response regulator transcription factor [unclassified Microbacterium]|uniref:response regulator transcription factor n=1 Tax=unclassified Microbacterium TaxID=2609290 RepID=UPI00214AF726|nr:MULTISPECIES: response regulator transcription factor [unclassified Microbacterium]MCR2808872.1 response regulator transcription factor [Microbacterium sp. zg.B185]WIM18710.1 response regulator transcription factor [Microbacterium sp. zg-B185]
MSASPAASSPHGDDAAGMLHSRTAKTAVVIEDDPIVRELLLEVFESAGFAAIGTDNGGDGVALVAEHRPQVTTVDVSMPGIDGFETVRRVRALSDTFILLVTASTDESDVVLGLSIGADDYVTKPFRPREFRARVEAMLRRPRLVDRGEQTASSVSAAELLAHVLNHRDLSLDTSTRVVCRGDRELLLTRTEFDLLQTLLESERRPRSKEDLARVARGDHLGAEYVTDLDKRAIEVHITNLRRKLGDSVTQPNYIETVRGIGYRLTEPAQV